MPSDEFEHADPVDSAGHSIYGYSKDAVGQNSRQALETAQTLAEQLRAARDRIAQLEGDVAAYAERAERAELWLDKIRSEIEQQFPRNGANAPR